MKLVRKKREGMDGSMSGWEGICHARAVAAIIHLIPARLIDSQTNFYLPLTFGPLVLV